MERRKVVLPSQRAYWVHQPPLEPNPIFWPTTPNREQRGYQKSDPGGDHYYVGCLGQTRVSLPE